MLKGVNDPFYQKCFVSSSRQFLSFIRLYWSSAQLFKPILLFYRAKFREIHKNTTNFYGNFLPFFNLWIAVAKCKYKLDVFAEQILTRSYRIYAFGRVW